MAGFQNGFQAGFQGATSSGAYSLAAGAGDFTLTGSETGLRAARSLVADAGLLSVVGSAASLRAARVIATGAGGFVLTGTVTDFTYGPVGAGYTLSIQVGACAIGGSNAVLRAARTLLAVGGAYDIQGSDVVVRVHRRLPLDQSNLVVTGLAAGLRGGRVLRCSPGALEIHGHAMSFGDTQIVLPAARIYRDNGERRLVMALTEKRIAPMVPERRIWPGTLK